MKKLFLTIIISFFFNNIIYSQKTYVPDDNFEQLLIDYGYDSFLDDSVLTSNINTIYYFDIYNTLISDLTGIQDFTLLESLSVEFNSQLISLDLSANSNLNFLGCTNNSQLTNLIVTNTNLNFLSCYNNPQLDSIDASNNINLNYVEMQHCQSLSFADLGGNSALTQVYCSNTNLSTIDLSGCINLSQLEISENELTSIDLSDNINLNYLHLSYNQLTNLDLTNNLNLQNVYCSNNQLTTLDLGNNSLIRDLNIEQNQLTNLNLSLLTNLRYLYCNNNQLNNLDFTNIVDLRSLSCSNNQLTNLDLTGVTTLDYIDCSNNQLTTLDLNGNSNLVYVNCSWNQITNLNISGNSQLYELNCNGNLLSAIDLTSNYNLERLNCASNQINSLDLSSNTSLFLLFCSYNQITSLDLANLSDLTQLWCWNNQLVDLDLSNNYNLQYLDCSSNQLTSLNVKNGNNINFPLFSLSPNFVTTNNNNLYCIDVDNVSFAQITFTNIDPWTSFSTNCTASVGCTDSLACNYDSLAQINNGSCLYSSISTTIVNACDNFQWNGVLYDSSGTYFYHTTNLSGCDSIATLELTIDNSVSSTDIQTACDSYTWIDGNTYTSSNNTASYFLQTVNGCDSIIYLDLQLNNSVSYTDVQVACDSFTWIDGNTYTSSNNTAMFVSQATNGCDSIIYLDLSLFGKPIVQIFQFGIDLQLLVSGGILPYSFNWNTMENTQTITPNGSGIYWCVVSDDNGCFSDTVFYNYLISSIDEINTFDKVFKVTDLLGKEIPFRKNTPMIFLYDDGTYRKKVVIE